MWLDFCTFMTFYLYACEEHPIWKESTLAWPNCLNWAASAQACWRTVRICRQDLVILSCLHCVGHCVMDLVWFNWVQWVRNQCIYHYFDDVHACCYSFMIILDVFCGNNSGISPWYKNGLNSYHILRQNWGITLAIFVLVWSCRNALECKLGVF